MRITLNGVRGTSAVTNPAFREFGGDTTSFDICGQGGEEVIVDFGSGLNAVRERMSASEQPLLALMTHYHLDHLAAFPAFPRIYRPGAPLRVVGPPVNGKDVKAVFSEIMAPPFWPQQVHMLKADLVFETLGAYHPDQVIRHGGLEIRWCPVHHPGGCVAYRLDEPESGQSVLIATDMEWALSTEAERTAFLHLCTHPHPVGLLAFDGHFAPEAYPSHVQWGHSTWRDGVEIVRATGAQKLVIIHHAPDQDDAALRTMERQLQAVLPDAEYGRQGTTYEGTELIHE